MSTGIYKSLNCGIGSKDKKIILNKIKNCKNRISKNLKIFLVHQTHSNKFVFIDENLNF